MNLLRKNTTLSILPRTFVLLGTIVCLSSIPSYVQGQTWAQKMFKEFAHDFGTVAKGAEVEHRFEIQNLYKEEIKIKSVTSSCGCTDVSLSTNSLKTWEKGYVIAKFNTRTFVGQKQATLTVRFDYPFVGEVQLNVRGNIRGDVQFLPGSIDFGQLVQSSPNKQNIQITKFGDRNWRIVDVKSTFDSIRVQLSKPMITNSGVTYQMSVRLAPDVPTGFVNGELFVIAREFGRDVDIPLRFSAKVDSALQISPPVVTINSKGPGDEFKQKIIVKADKPFKITDVICDDDCFKFQPKSNAERKLHFVEMVFTGNNQTGKRECDVKIVTDFNGKATGNLKAIVNVAAKGE